MAFFDKVGETVSEKGREVADKAKKMAEIANLKSQISTCEQVIKKNYAEIGKKYYEAYANAEDAEFAKQCDAITNAKHGIAELEKQIKEIKGV